MAPSAELMESQLQAGDCRAGAGGYGRGLVPVEVWVVALLCQPGGGGCTYLFRLVDCLG